MDHKRSFNFSLSGNGMHAKFCTEIDHNPLRKKMILLIILMVQWYEKHNDSIVQWYEKHNDPISHLILNVKELFQFPL